MIFTEFRFLLFFGIVFCVYWLLSGNHWRKVWILACSYVFYGAWDWRFLSLIMGTTLMDYCVARKIGAADNPQARRNWLLVSLIVNLSVLGFFKYANFFADSAVGFFSWMGLPVNSVTLNVLLPAGISFYTFQTLSYSIDVYRGQLEPRKSLLDIATFISFFPQLVAGPIVRAADFLPQLDSARSFRQVNVRTCLILFMVGFFKKACLSDNLAPLVDRYFSAPQSYDALSSWIAVLSYTVQIYCDFSGYSDMAIACAGLLGYQLCLNFNFPYFASSITDFWRRWHISLSTWLKDYLYIPLGGNRGGKWFTYRNLMLTMLLGGLWHGAAWTFVGWGALHGIALVAHKEWHKFSQRIPALAQPSKVLGAGVGRVFAIAALLVTFYWVCITWIFFRADSFGAAMQTLKSFVLLRSPGSEHLSSALLALFAALALLHWLTARQVWIKLVEQLPAQVFAVGYGFAAALVLTLMPLGYTPFIYFQF